MPQNENTPMPIESCPVIVCGAHGGGTSYVMKVLRFAGLFAGHDAGPIRSRKFHESAAYKCINRAIGEKFGDRDILSADVVRAVEEELAHKSKVWIDHFASVSNSLEQEYGVPENRPVLNIAIHIAGLLNRFVPRWRWTWPGYLCSKFRYRPSSGPWGWKDPRNSVTLPLWQAIYPSARVLIISKNVDDRGAQSPSGAWFRDSRNLEVVDRYQSPELGGGDHDVHRISFEALTRDPECLNGTLAWLGLRPISRRRYLALLKATDFEGNLSDVVGDNGE